MMHIGASFMLSKMRWLLLLGYMVFPLSGFAGEDTLFLQRVATYAKNTAVSGAVRRECDLESKIPLFVKKYARSDVKYVDNAAAVKNGKVLVIEITDVLGSGGGAWSGAKSLTIHGVLKDNGKEIASFDARRISGGGAFGGFKGTCSILGRSAKALGKDVALWLRNPAPGAKLGDLR